MPFLLFLKGLDFRWWIIIAMSVVMMGLFAGFKIQSIRVDSLKNDLAKKDIVIEQYKNNIATLSDSIKKQNDAIVAMADQNKEFASTLAAANDQNERMNVQAGKLISMIKTAYVPPDCKGATDHLDAFSKNFAKEWNSK